MVAPRHTSQRLSQVTRPTIDKSAPLLTNRYLAVAKFTRHHLFNPFLSLLKERYRQRHSVSFRSSVPTQDKMGVMIRRRAIPQTWWLCTNPFVILVLVPVTLVIGVYHLLSPYYYGRFRNMQIYILENSKSGS